MDGMNCILTFAKAWALVDEKTKQEKKGLTVEYLMTDSLTPTTSDDGSAGIRHCKESIDISKCSKIVDVPALYTLHFKLKPGSKGKPEMKLDDITFVKSLNVIEKKGA